MRRGENVALTREIPSLTSVVLGTSLSAGSETKLLENLVMATILCDANSKAISDEHFVFFNQLSSPEESVAQRDQALGPDLEQVVVDLHAVPPEVERIVVVLYLNEGVTQHRSFGQLKQCTIRVLNGADGAELVRSENLAEAFVAETAVTLGELYRHQNGWKFKVIGDGYSNGVRGIAAYYGVDL
jgi:tellurium resistance protein TerD